MGRQGRVAAYVLDGIAPGCRGWPGAGEGNRSARRSTRTPRVGAGSARADGATDRGLRLWLPGPIAGEAADVHGSALSVTCAVAEEEERIRFQPYTNGLETPTPVHLLCTGDGSKPGEIR
jgi:hypothetical protein